jgi:hypothetical protein
LPPPSVSQCSSIAPPLSALTARYRSGPRAGHQSEFGDF